MRKILARVLAERIELGQFDLAGRARFRSCDLVLKARNRCSGSFRGMIELREPR